MATTVTTAATLTVKIVLNDTGNPAGKLADAELNFTDGPLAGARKTENPEGAAERPLACS